VKILICGEGTWSGCGVTIHDLANTVEDITNLHLFTSISNSNPTLICCLLVERVVEWREASIFSHLTHIVAATVGAS
jgi:hypothetical protein